MTRYYCSGFDINNAFGHGLGDMFLSELMDTKSIVYIPGSSEKIQKVKDKYLTHFWDFRIKDGQANDYQEFYLKYYNKLNNPFYFGYLVHLIVDQYWKTYIDPKFEALKNGIHRTI